MDENDIKDTELKSYVLFAKIVSNPPDKSKLDEGLRTILGAKSEHHCQGSENDWLHIIIRHNLSVIWLTSLKYDVFLEKYKIGEKE